MEENKLTIEQQDNSPAIRTLPVFVLRGRVMFPGINSQFEAGRAMSRHAVQQAVADDNYLFVVTQKNSLDEQPAAEDIYKTGVVCRVTKILNVTEKSMRVQLSGLERAKIADIYYKDECYFADVETLQYEVTGGNRNFQRLLKNRSETSQRTI